jgi:hypothetical protein
MDSAARWRGSGLLPDAGYIDQVAAQAVMCVWTTVASTVFGWIRRIRRVGYRVRQSFTHRQVQGDVLWGYR